MTNNDIFNGVNSSQISINLRELPDTTYYFAEIEGKCGIIKTRTVKVIKNLNLIQLEIAGLDACEGNIESIKAQIINTENHKLEFRWYKDGKPIYFKENLKGMFSDELIFNPIFMTDAGKYKVEAKIREINYSVFSNEVDVKVGKEPKIVCVRIDTIIGCDETLTGQKNYTNSWLNIFYEKNSLPIQFDIYRNGELVDSKSSDSSVFSLGNIEYLDYVQFSIDSSRFWVIAHNKCGYAYSDTISLYEQTICDPFNQFHKKCVYEPFAIYLNYKAREPVNQLKYWWYSYSHRTSIYDVPLDLPHAKATVSKLELKDFTGYQMKDNDKPVLEFNTRYEVRRKIGNITFEEDEFCCFYLTIGYIPKILRQPVNKQLSYGENDTVIYIYFDNDFGKKIEVELYYMASLSNKPRLIDKAVPDWVKWYNYIKDVTFAEDGYYYAVSRYDNDCNPVISDTVRVIVNPNGSISSVNTLESNSGLLIQPNPASDYITIAFDRWTSLSKWSPSDKVQIFDMLGIEVLSESIHPLSSSHRMNVDKLPAGVYFIRIGNKVEKFVKM